MDLRNRDWLQLLRSVRIAYFELRQSGWLIVVPPALVMLAVVVFLFLHFSPILETREQALRIFQHLAVLLVPVAALLWAYFFVGNIYERAKSIFDIHGQVYLAKLVLRAGVPFSFFIYASIHFLSLSAPDYSQEISFIAARAIAISIAYFILLAVSSLLFKSSHGGFLVALFFTLFSYGIVMGWLTNVPIWLNPVAEQSSFAHIWFLGIVAVLLYVVLYALEKSKL